MELELVPKEEATTPEKRSADVEQTRVFEGRDRRRSAQRKCVDRREMVRFEVKTDRRRGMERRSELQLWQGRA